VLLVGRNGTPAISDGLRTLERASPWRLVPLWGSLALGVLGLLHVLLVGPYRAARGRMGRRDPLLAPTLAVLVLIVACALLARQPILQLGDRTAASMLLAAASSMLALAAALGLWQALRAAPTRPGRLRDAIALAALVQWLVVLATWGLLPLRLWA